MNQQSFELRVGLLKQMFDCVAKGLYLTPLGFEDQREFGVFGVQLLCAPAPEELADKACQLGDEYIGIDKTAGIAQVAIQFIGIQEILALKQEMLRTMDPYAGPILCFLDQSVLGTASAGSHPKSQMN